MIKGVKDTVCSFENLHKAMLKCCKGVMWKDSVARYTNNGLTSIHNLHNSLMDGTYKIDKYCNFFIYEPKKRSIVSTKLKDRVFQRSLCDNYLYTQITKGFIYDNGACQIGKGTDFAMDRLDCHLQRFFREHGPNGYILKCDIKDYFGSTPHAVAKQVMKDRVADEWALGHVYDIIDSYGTPEKPDTGMGLGSQVTQLIQLAVLDDMDHFIKERLRIKHYIRYMDDFPLIHHDKPYLLGCRTEIEKELKRIGLRLNARKTQMFPISQGVNFLGFKFRLTDTGRVLRLLSKENIRKRKRKLRKYKGLVGEGRMTRERADECYESWKSHARKGDSYNLLKRMDEYYSNLWRDNDV